VWTILLALVLFAGGILAVVHALRRHAEHETARPLLRDVAVADEPGAENRVPRTPAITARGAAITALVALIVWIAIRVGLPRGRDSLSTGNLDGFIEQITTERGLEAFPTLSPDGEWVAYRGGIGAQGDIYLQQIGRQRVANLTSGLNADDSDPSFSPDGRQIAFRSTYNQGGIFVMDRDGGAPRRLSRFGASPAWTPDGTAIVFATRSSLDPRAWSGLSEGWIVNVRSRQLTRLTRGDFRQPSVSPNGRFIAYWTLPPPMAANGLRRPAASGIRITNIDGRYSRAIGPSSAMDWNPVWSPDGAFIYFLSDRDGRTAVWRMAVDPRSGTASGDPARVLTPRGTATHVAMARRGSHLAWSTLEWSPAMFRIEFESDTRSVRGAPATVGTSRLAWRCAEPSPDQSTLALLTDQEEPDVYVVPAEGGEPIRVTADAAVEGCPRWSPDGRQIAFHSNAGGLNQIWTAGADGTGLHVAAGGIGDVTHPAWTPDGREIAAWDAYLATVRVFQRGARGAARAETLRKPPHPFTPVAWSPDGTQLAGTAAGSVWLYVRASRTYEPLAPGSAPTWLSTSRRLILASEGRLVLFDVPSRYTREILAMPDLQLDVPFLSRDNRHLYYHRNAAESSLWLLTLR
jgi:Tol biopolymer transport system component